MGIERVEIGNAIIAGIASGDTALEQMSEIVSHLERAGFVIVPITPTDDMLEELARIGDGPDISGAEVWGYMLAAADAVTHT